MSTPEPTPTIRPTAYRVNCLSDDDDEERPFGMDVVAITRNRWVITRNGAHLGADGTWSHGVPWPGREEPATPEEWDAYHEACDAWYEAHQFDRITALRLARQAAPHITVHRTTVAQALAYRKPQDTPDQPDTQETP